MRWQQVSAAQSCLAWNRVVIAYIVHIQTQNINSNEVNLFIDCHTRALSTYSISLSELKTYFSIHHVLQHLFKITPLKNPVSFICLFFMSSCLLLCLSQQITIIEQERSLVNRPFWVCFFFLTNFNFMIHFCYFWHRRNVKLEVIHLSG